MNAKWTGLAVAAALIVGAPAVAAAAHPRNPDTQGSTTRHSAQVTPKHADSEAHGKGRGQHSTEGTSRQGRHSETHRGTRGPGSQHGSGPGHRDRHHGGHSTAELGTLTAQQADQLAYLTEEEIVARNLYLAFYDQYGNDVFQRIARSETQHYNTMTALANDYGISVNTAGELTDPALIETYNTLLERGSTSLQEALRVAIDIETSDINDLTSAQIDLYAPRAEQTYQRLTEASENHLDAFTRTLNQ